MLFKNKNKRFKPLYKKFIKLKENIQNRTKLLKFKKEKWKKFIQAYKNKLKKYKKFKLKDQVQYVVSRYSSRKLSYKKRYKNNTINIQKLKLFYGHLSRKYIKKILNKKHNKKNISYLKLFETRLDTILYRSKFSISIKNARQLILHKKIFVNNKPIQIQSYIVKSGDLITINPKYTKLIRTNIQKSKIWPIPPKHLIINYKTLQIIFGTLKNTNFSQHFYHLNLEQILESYYQY